MHIMVTKIKQLQSKLTTNMNQYKKEWGYVFGVYCHFQV